MVSFTPSKNGFNTLARNKGFTLVELLVVISIIAILSVVGITVFSGVQTSARDAKRKADIDAIYTALEIYYSVNGRYPEVNASCTSGTTSACNNYFYSTAGSSWISALVPNYMRQVPVDPKNNAGAPWTNGNYSYAYGNVGPTGQYYDLTTQLENTSDSARCGVKNYKFFWNNQSWCPYYSNQIYEKSPPGPSGSTAWP